MKKYFYLLLFTIHYSLFTAFIGCGKKATQQTQQTQQTQRPKPKLPEYVPPPPPPKYTYKGSAYRDPLLPGGAASYSSSIISGEGGEIMTNEKIATLQLKGIFRDEKTGGIAIISESAGSSYILKNGKLYDRKNKIVRGVAGVVGKKSVTLFSSDTKLELKLKKSWEGKK